MEAICSSETSVGIQRTTRRYIPEDDILQIGDFLYMDLQKTETMLDKEDKSLEPEVLPCQIFHCFKVGLAVQYICQHSYTQ
jgi:hypothetical protein